MPAALKLVVALLGFAVLAAGLSLGVQQIQLRAAARSDAAALTGGDPVAGQVLIGTHGCGACHVVPGVNRADGRAGPSLEHVATQAFLAGRLVNQPDEMIGWLQHPEATVPGGGMPDTGLSGRDARDIAAYLYTLR